MAKLSTDEKRIVKRIAALRELLAEFGLRLHGYDPGISCMRADGKGRLLDFEHHEWETLEPLLLELRNARVSANGVPTVDDVPELDSDDDFALVADAISVARQVQEFIWADCYPTLRPYDSEGWRRLFQKRVDCIAEVDLTRHGGLAALRKRLLQQAALSIKALALVNRWFKLNPPALSSGADGTDLATAASPADAAALEAENQRLKNAYSLAIQCVEFAQGKRKRGWDIQFVKEQLADAINPTPVN